MKKVEILTANTIPIQYETASLMNRGIALFLDLVVKFVYVLIVLLFFSFFSISSNAFLSDEFSAVIFHFAFIWFPMTFYSLFMEYLMKGQTVGKLIMGIRVVSMNGENASLNDYIMRWTFRMVDFYLSAGGLGAILISTTENGQRLGDILAQTVVIRSNPTQLYSMQDILKIKTKSDYEPVYLGVTKFTDDDMIILKNTLSRYKKHPNAAHKEAVIQLTTRIVEELNLSEMPKQKLAFLRAILQDYIVLTR